jgi:hypothetical protein
MPDTWNSLTLGDIFPGPSSTIGSLKGQADNLFARYGRIQSQLNAKVAALETMKNESTTLANGLTQAGFYRINLAPSVGGWADRASSAAGAPPNEGYSCGILIVVQAPDLLSLGDKYTKLTSMLTSPVNLG